MAKFIVLELARENDDSDSWFYTGRSFIAVSTAQTVDEIMNSDFYPKNFNVQCNSAFGQWQGVEIHLQPQARNKPTLVKVLDYALPLMV